MNGYKQLKTAVCANSQHNLCTAGESEFDDLRCACHCHTEPEMPASTMAMLDMAMGLILASVDGNVDRSECRGRLNHSLDNTPFDEAGTDTKLVILVGVLEGEFGIDLDCIRE